MLRRALLIDGSFVIYRCFHSVNARPDSMTAKKLKDNFFNLFALQLKKWVQLQKYHFGAFFFDSDRKSFRAEILPTYKADRPPMPQELLDWIPEIIEKAKEIGINSVFAPKGYEADDLIGTISKQLAQSDFRVDIISSDKDLLQLVDYSISVIRIKSSFGLEINSYMNFSELNEGLLPSQIPFFKALTGDPSDNYSGIPGIGAKNAIKLIRDYPTKERLLSSLNLLAEGKIKTSLKENLENLEKFFKLATIQTGLKFKFSLADFVIKNEDNSGAGKPN